MDSTLIILEKVDGFYNHAFSNLVMIVLGAIAILGIGMPLLINWLQNRRFDSDRKLLKQEIESALYNVTNEIISETEQNVSTRLTEVEARLTTDINRKLDIAQGMIFHLQSNTMRKHVFSWESRAVSLLNACNCYLRGKHLYGFNQLFEILIEVGKEWAPNYPITTDSKLPDLMEAVIAQMKELDDQGQYMHQIIKLEGIRGGLTYSDE